MGGRCLNGHHKPSLHNWDKEIVHCSFSLFFSLMSRGQCVFSITDLWKAKACSDSCAQGRSLRYVSTAALCGHRDDTYPAAFAHSLTPAHREMLFEEENCVCPLLILAARTLLCGSETTASSVTATDPPRKWGKEGGGAHIGTAAGRKQRNNLWRMERVSQLKCVKEG